jgi:hypothetical protein
MSECACIQPTSYKKEMLIPLSLKRLTGEEGGYKVPLSPPEKLESSSQTQQQ